LQAIFAFKGREKAALGIAHVRQFAAESLFHSFLELAEGYDLAYLIAEPVQNPDINAVFALAEIIKFAVTLDVVGTKTAGIAAGVDNLDALVIIAAHYCLVFGRIDTKFPAPDRFAFMVADSLAKKVMSPHFNRTFLSHRNLSFTINFFRS
jgi:hypothetical protein